MNKLSNDIIGNIYEFLTYKDTISLEKTNILPKEFYKDTNKEYKIKKMQKELDHKNKLIKNILEHECIKKCGNPTCNKVDTIPNINLLNDAGMETFYIDTEFNIESTENNILTKCSCNNEYYCNECLPTSYICQYCPKNYNRHCRTCVPKFQLECKKHQSISICVRCVRGSVMYPLQHSRYCNGTYCEKCRFCEECKHIVDYELFDFI